MSRIHRRQTVLLLPLFAGLIPGLLDAAPVAPRGGCPLPPATLSPLSGVAEGVVVLEADAVELRQSDKSATFSGRVQVQQGDMRIEAGRVIYLQEQQHLTAEGGVRLERPDIRLFSEQLDYRFDQRQGSASQARYEIPGAGGRGRAALIEIPQKEYSRHHQISYTTCLEAKEYWQLTAKELELRHDQGLGTVHSARLEVMDVPLLYLPELTFPIDGKRHSGFLVPTIGYSGDRGLDVELPYYLNLAPDYDLTLMPRVMSKRGILLGAEGRFLTARQAGSLLGEWMPDDREKGGDSQRGYLSLAHDATLNPHWRSHIRADYASDHKYLDDLGSDLDYVSGRQLERVWEMRYQRRDWSLLSRVQHFQILDQTIASVDHPYSRWPQLLFEMNKTVADGLNFGLQQEYVYFYRDTGTTGHRIDITPSLTYRWETPSAYLSPRVSARYTTYQLSELTPGQAESPDRSLAGFSLDSGLFYERSDSWFGHAVTQTLEPRLHYLYVPEVDQDDLPVFDTDLYDFSFDNLFRENRYNGPDRVGDANRLTLALSSRLRSRADGRELGHLGIGQVFHFRDRLVTLPGALPQNEGSSSLVAEMAAQPHRNWRFSTGLEWDPDQGDSGTLQQAIARVAYRDGMERNINFGYRMREGELNQLDLAASLPIDHSTRVIGRWIYSTEDDRTLDALAGIEFGDCCWRIRTVARQRNDEDSNSSDLSLLLQVELRGLARIGSNIESLLSGRLAGYRSN